MINFALTKCDFLTVLVCCSDKESIQENIEKLGLKRHLKKRKILK